MVVCHFIPSPHPTPPLCVFVTPRAVTCPDLSDVVTTCDVGCTSDDACEGNQICCPGGCSSLCVDPVRLTCPDVSGVAGACVESCRNSSQCDSGRLCCSNGCGRACVVADELNCSVSLQQPAVAAKRAVQVNSCGPGLSSRPDLTALLCPCHPALLCPPCSRWHALWCSAAMELRSLLWGSAARGVTRTAGWAGDQKGCLVCT